MSEPVYALWSPGEPEDDLHGFPTKKERDACARGESGPFRRIVRNHHDLGPVSPERKMMLEMFAKWDAATKATGTMREGEGR